jgi:molybdopterin biosynthesis enzyme MoaB
VSTPAAVITVSDRSAAGIRADAAGPIAVAALRDAGFDCAEPVVTPDGAMPRSALAGAAAGHA